MFKLKKSKLTDDEFVENLRAQLKASRKAGFYLSMFSVAAFFGLCFLLQWLSDSLMRSDEFDPGLKLGFTIGLFLAFALFKLARLVFEAVMMWTGVHYSRSTMLLIKYYDLARENASKVSDVTRPLRRAEFF